MAIPGMSSKEIHDIILSANSRITQVSDEIDAFGEHIAHLSNIQEFQYEYAQEMWLRTPHSPQFMANDVILASPRANLQGNCQVYGTTVIPKVIREKNLFNLRSTSGYLYRTDAAAKVGNFRDNNYEMFLKHQSIQDRPFFTLLTNDFFKVPFDPEAPVFDLEVYIDTPIQAGNTFFNSIELHPHLPGSFVIEALQILENEDTGWETIATNLPGAPMRLMLERSYAMLAVILRIRMTEKVKGGWHFGLKHLHFFESDFDPASNIVFEVERPKHLRSIGSAITVQTPYGRRETTLAEMGAKLYIAYNNGIAEHEIHPSTLNSNNVILRNIKKFYVQMPVPVTGITSVFFHSIQER